MEILGDTNEGDKEVEDISLANKPIRFNMREIGHCISLHVVNGVQGYQTKRISGLLVTMQEINPDFG